MNHRSVSTLLLIALLSSHPVLAQSEKVEKGEVSESKTAPPANVISFPKAAAGVIAGLTIGIPVKISKDVRTETKRFARALHSDMGSEFGIMETLFVVGGAVPFGLMSGVIMGTVRGTERAFLFGANQPFCPESLGMKEPEHDPEIQ